MALLIQNASYVIVSADQVLTDADVCIAGNRILAVGKGLPSEGCERIINARGKICCPGFISAHTHLYQNMLKGRGDALRLKEWCEEVTFPFANIIHAHRRRGDERVIYAYGLLGAVEMIQSGITAFVDMDTVTDSLLNAWKDVGIRGIAAVQSVNRWVPPELMVPDGERLAKIEELIDKWHGDGLVDIWIGPSTPFACTPEFMNALGEIADRRQIGIQVHVSETRWEVEQSVRDVGMTPLRYLESIGFLERPMMAVHGVHLTPEEFELCASRGISVCYNPKSNGKLGSGIAPIAELQEQGITTCLANDGAASNDLLDIFEDMRFGAMLQKLKYEDPGRFGEKEIFRMATEGGARALGIDAGKVEAGRLADIILVNISAPSMSPLHDPISALVYCGRAQDVDTVIVNGRIILENRKFTTLDAEEEVREAVAVGKSHFAEIKTGPLHSAF